MYGAESNQNELSPNNKMSSQHPECDVHIQPKDQHIINKYNYCHWFHTFIQIQFDRQISRPIVHHTHFFVIFPQGFEPGHPCLNHFCFEVIVVFHYGNAIRIEMCTPLAVDIWTIYYSILGCFMVSNSD